LDRNKSGKEKKHRTKMGNQNKHCTKTESQDKHHIKMGNQNKQLHAVMGVTHDEEITKKKIQTEHKNM
jgi:hypothetical protein